MRSFSDWYYDAYSICVREPFRALKWWAHKKPLWLQRIVASITRQTVYVCMCPTQDITMAFIAKNEKAAIEYFGMAHSSVWTKWFEEGTAELDTRTPIYCEGSSAVWVVQYIGAGEVKALEFQPVAPVPVGPRRVC